MDYEPTIILHCLRNDGRRETTQLTDSHLSDARELAKRMLHLGNGLYKEVEICNEHGHVETIQLPALADTIWMT